MKTYCITHPNHLTATRTATGAYVVLVAKVDDRFITLADMRDLDFHGEINIVEVGGNTLADDYNRVRVVYTIN